MKLITNFISVLKEKRRRFITNRNAKKRTSDVERWKQKEALFEDWNERTRLMAQYIPEQVSVLEFGAAKLALKKYLPESVTYRPSDIVDRGEGTLVCDLNDKDYPEFDNQDILFFSGVLEYIFDVPKLIAYLSHKTELFIVSYCTFDNFSITENRKINGWVNAYTNEEFTSIFKDNGFQVIETEEWRSQNIYVFKKE